MTSAISGSAADLMQADCQFYGMSTLRECISNNNGEESAAATPISLEEHAADGCSILSFRTANCPKGQEGQLELYIDHLPLGPAPLPTRRWKSRRETLERLPCAALRRLPSMSLAGQLQSPGGEPG